MLLLHEIISIRIPCVLRVRGAKSLLEAYSLQDPSLHDDLHPASDRDFFFHNVFSITLYYYIRRVIRQW